MKKVLAACVVVVALAASAPAFAAKYLITYTGTVGKGATDGFEIFGPASLDLYNMAFTAAYTLDTSVPGLETGWPSNRSLYGGTSIGFGNPLTAALTINGVTVNLGSAASQTTLVNQRNGANDQIYHAIADVDSVSGDVRTTINIFNKVLGTQVVSSADYTDPLNYTVQLGDDAVGAFTWVVGDAQTNQLIKLTQVGLVASAVSIKELAVPVPEPGTWGLLVAGFGAVGAMLRRRRTATAS